MAAPKFKSLEISHDATAICELYRGDLHVGDFVCRYINTSGAAFRLAMVRRNQRLTPSELRRLENPKDEADVAWARRRSIEMLLDQGGLVDWQVEGADGKRIPFTRENAILLLTQPGYEWVYDRIDNFVITPGNFQPQAEAIAGE